MKGDYQMEIAVMEQIMEEKTKDLASQNLIPLDAEGKTLAEEKRKAFDLPTNAVKVDPLR